MHDRQHGRGNSEGVMHDAVRSAAMGDAWITTMSRVMVMGCMTMHGVV